MLRTAPGVPLGLCPISPPTHDGDAESQRRDQRDRGTAGRTPGRGLAVFYSACVSSVSKRLEMQPCWNNSQRRCLQLEVPPPPPATLPPAGPILPRGRSSSDELSAPASCFIQLLAPFLFPAGDLWRRWQGNGRSFAACGAPFGCLAGATAATAAPRHPPANPRDKGGSVVLPPRAPYGCPRVAWDGAGGRIRAGPLFINAKEPALPQIFKGRAAMCCPACAAGTAGRTQPVREGLKKSEDEEGSGSAWRETRC